VVIFTFFVAALSIFWGILSTIGSKKKDTKALWHFMRSAWNLFWMLMLIGFFIKLATA